MEEGTHILKPFELHYSDLLLLSSHNLTSSSQEENERLVSVTGMVMEALGSHGPGLINITGVPNSSSLRQYLLPLARKLALLNPEERKRILKEQNLGSDVPLKSPERSVSSFAMQLRYERNLEIMQRKQCHEDDQSKYDKDWLDGYTMRGIEEDEFKNLGSNFKELGSCMIELGLRVACLCDRAIHGKELEQSLLESCTAKGRLIHYHSTLDNAFLKGSRNGVRTSHSVKERKGKVENDSSLWQQWHYDYGIFTVLTSPQFFMSPLFTVETEAKYPSCYEECSSPSGHTYLQILDPRKNTIFMVSTPPDSFILQVGESADVISKGKLRSALHSVSKPTEFENLCRETFVVFLQPSWNKTFSMSEYPSENLAINVHEFEEPREGSNLAQHDQRYLAREIQRLIPPLPLRLKEGMTFAEFSRETTKQYYGGNGLQSNR